MSRTESDDLRLAYEVFDATRSLPPDALDNYIAAHPGIGDDPERRKIRDLVGRIRRAHPDTQVVDFTAEFGLELKPDLESRFQIRRVIGHGGLGIVFLAFDRQLGREVAIKQILSELDDGLGEPPNRKPFLYEAFVTGKLEHPGVLPVYAVGLDSQSRPYYAMKLIGDQTLEQAIASYHSRTWCSDTQRRSNVWCVLSCSNRWSSPPSKCPDTPGLTRLLRHLINVCHTIQHAHTNPVIRVIHRDLKPVHVYLGPDNETIVLDWGLAREIDPRSTFDPAAARGPSRARQSPTVTETLGIAGTLEWMAPEQAWGTNVGPAADIFGLGALLYAILTGSPPRRSADLAIALLAQAERGDGSPDGLRSALRRFVDQEIVFPSEPAAPFPRPLESIARKALAKDPARRFANPKELADEILSWIQYERVRCHDEGVIESIGRRIKKQRVAVLTGAAGVVTLVIAIVALWSYLVQRNAAEVQRNAAKEQRLVRAQLLQSRVFAAQQTQIARSNGYTKVVFEEVRKAQQLAPETETLQALRNAAVGSMGDFTGLGPVEEMQIAAGPDAGIEKAVGISRDGRAVMARQPGNSISVWEFPHGSKGTPFTSAVDRLWLDAGTLIAVHKDGKIRVWEDRRGAGWGLIAEASASPDWTQTALSPDRRHLAMASAPDPKVSIWALRKNGTLEPMGGAIRLEDKGIVSVTHVGLAGQGTDLLLAVIFHGGDPDKIRQQLRFYRWRGHGWERVGVDEDIPVGWGAIYALAFSRDARYLCISGEIITVYETGKNKEYISIGGDQSSRAAFSPDGMLMACVSAQLCEVRVWSIPRRRVVAVLRHEHHGPILNIGFSEDGRRLVVAGLKSVRAWDLTAAAEKYALDGHRLGISGLAFHPGGCWLASTSKDRSVRVWDLQGRRQLQEFSDFSGFVQAIAFSSDGRWLATGDWTDSDQEGQVRIYRTGCWERRTVLRNPGLGKKVWQVGFHPNNDSLAASGLGGLKLWAVGRDGTLDPSESLSTQPVKSFSYDISGRYLGWIELPKNGRPSLRVRNLRRGGTTHETVQASAAGQMGPTDTALGVTTIAEGRFAFISAPILGDRNGQGEVVDWDAVGEFNGPLFKIPGDVDIGAVLAASAGSTGRLRLAVQSGMTAEVLELNVGGKSDAVKRLFQLPRGEGIVWSMAWSQDGQHLAIGTSDGELAIWSLEAVLKQLDGLRLSP